MAADDVTGTDWSESEIDLIVADYFDMLSLEQSGQPYVKAHRNAALQALTGRSRGSIERKHHNISAILHMLGERWINGYKPLHNYQRALVDGVERYISDKSNLLKIQQPAEYEFSEGHQLYLGEAPTLSARHTSSKTGIDRLVRKFDPAARDLRNRTLGKLGEECVLQFERDQLANADRHDLARKVKWVSELEGDGAGYDIHSYDSSGNDRLVEVKTTRGPDNTPFFLTENERSLSEERPNAFKLMRLFDFAQTPRAFELTPPLELVVNLQPTNYRASF